MYITVVLNPMASARFCPEKRSPMIAKETGSNGAAPIPCNPRRMRSVLKSGAKAHAPPNIPKRKREGTMSFFLPNLSAIIPVSGTSRRLGRVNTLISSPIDCSLIPSASTIVGKAGVMTAAIIIPIRLAPQMIWKFRLR
jgi:hypothetical protein